jgi:hypothetical protein
VRAWSALDVPVPWIAPDEMTYGLAGESLYRSGSLDILGGPTPYFSALVPAFVGLPLSLGNLVMGYDLLKVLQALTMSLTAVPVFVWGRSLCGPRWALVAAALTLALPGLVYSGLVMTEVLFYPLLVLAGWAAARAIERPSLAAQALLVAAIAVATLTRLQALVLVPAVLGAYGLDAAIARSTATIRRSLPVLGLGVVALVALGAVRLAGGEVLGGYGVVTHGGYSLGSAARYVVYHAASLTILTGVFPVCALLLLLVGAVRGGEPSRSVRAFLAVTASFSAWLVVEVGVFASQYVGRLAERDLIGLAPLLFLALAVWIDRGAPRGYWAMCLVGLAVAAPLAVLPLDRLVTSYAPPDAPTLTALWDLRQASSLRTLEIVFFVGAGAAILLFALLPRRRAAVLPALLLVALAGASVAAARDASQQAHDRQSIYLGPDRRWVDHAADGPTALLYTRGSGWVGAWETVFWNRRVTSVLGVGGARVFGPLPTTAVHIRPDGRIVTADGSSLRPAYVVAPLGEVVSVPAYRLAGTLVAFVRRPGSTAGGSALWRVDPPLRLDYRASGLQPNGDVYAGGDAHLTAFACHRGGVFRVTLLIKQPQEVTILRNGTFYTRIRFEAPAPNQPWRETIATVPRSGRNGTCTLDVRPEALIGTTVFEVDG